MLFKEIIPLQWESYEIHKYKIQGSRLLQQIVHISHFGFWSVNQLQLIIMIEDDVKHSLIFVLHVATPWFFHHVPQLYIASFIKSFSHHWENSGTNYLTT
jgi:hypothetical protein